jgi:membrane fusion protein (multidrug efflux system)
LNKGIATAAALGAVAAALLAWQRLGPASRPEAPVESTARTAVPVATARVERASLPGQVEALGTTQALEAVEITPRISSIVTAVRFTEGELVQAGAVLVELENAAELAAQSEAEATAIDSRSQYTRARELARTQAVSESQLLQLEAAMKAADARLRAAQARLDQTLVRAPFTGRTGLRQVSPGSLVTPGSIISTLDDLSSVRLDFAVPEAYLSAVAEGMTVIAQSVAWEDREFSGAVRTVSTRVDPVTRAVTVRAVLPNPDLVLKPGMFLTVRLQGAERLALLVPEAALVPEGDRQYVYRVRDARAWRTEVVIGQRLRGRVAIDHGLEEGDEVVIEGTQRLADGSPVRAAAPIAAAPIAATT